MTWLRAAAIAGCGDDDNATGGGDQTGAALEYDVVIAISEDRLSGMTDMCDAQGRQVQIAVEGPLTDGLDAAPTATVPDDATWLEGLEIFRDRACDSLPCELVVRAYVDDQEVAAENFTFVQP